MPRFKCPVCHREIEINIDSSKKPAGGLYEVFIQHMDHFIKAYVDLEGFVRRAFPVEHFYVAEPPLYTLRIYEDKAEIVDSKGHIYITDPAPLLEAIKKVTEY
ncbi:hypothetical protein ODS41_05705 [Pyrobaculum sp. 3827-6]|uniref:hypothetical protein n=1 Tax=Pyrobaculum sp. 3827-6 TaxID=2983604 RepID=UPI0021DA1F7D|nr:hypothetical protein [Pyrobaculum sp. 3827-6]MCU7787413.1 hypothetical protein [Pyrobaculum sp. 3827-6]